MKRFRPSPTVRGIYLLYSKYFRWVKCAALRGLINRKFFEIAESRVPAGWCKNIYLNPKIGFELFVVQSEKMRIVAVLTVWTASLHRLMYFGIEILFWAGLECRQK